MNTNEHKIPFGNDFIACITESMDNSDPQVLFINGFGTTNRANLDYLLSYYAENNIGTVRFDFIGQGNSTGLLEETTFHSRVDQTLAVIKYFNMKSNLTLLATSMGCYTASTVSIYVPCSNLIFFGPRAYSTEYYNIPFDDNFVKTIKTEKQFLQSDIIQSLTKHKGNSFIFHGGKDEGDPEIVEMYKKGLVNSNKCVYSFVEDSPHAIHSWVKDKPLIQQQIINTIKSA